MAKVMPFSRLYPAYHKRNSEYTFFVEKFWNSFRNDSWCLPDSFIPYVKEYEKHYFSSHEYLRGVCVWEIKYHTIRAGHRWKEGDMMSPRVWGTDINPKSGRSGPYHSKQIIIAPDTRIVKVYDFKIQQGQMYINGVSAPINNEILAANDGLEYEDFLSWFKFPKPFDGQIICWNDAAQYFV